MRIAHVLTYVSADGAFGGPVAVMGALTGELARRGHDVEIFAGWDGRFRYTVPGVDVHLYRTRRVVPGGFSGLVAPGLRTTLRRRASDFDVVHVHLARDLVTTPAALAVARSDRGAVLFVQTHGMVKPDTRARSRVFDIGIRRILRRASGVLALNDVDEERIESVAHEPISVLDLPNGVASQPEHVRPERAAPEVLFLARLQPRKRVMLFAEAARLVHERGVACSFVVVGPDEGDLEELRTFIERHDLSDVIVYEGSLPPGRGVARLAEADVYVLPSLNEPFPMSVLEALSVGTATIISSSCHISRRLSDAGAVMTFDADVDELAEAISLLVTDGERRRRLSVNGRAAVESEFSIEHVVGRLEKYYEAATHHAGSHRGGHAE